MTGRPTVVLFNSMLDPAGEEALAARATVRRFLEGAPAAEITEALGTADGLLVRLPWRVTRDVIAAAPRLRVVATAGAGVDHIDVAAATAAGVAVVNSAGIGPLPVAEHTVGMMLGLVRRIAAGDRRLRRGGWTVRQALIGPDVGGELTGKTVGVVGLGHIGRRVARIVRGAFDARVLAYDPPLDDAAFHAAGAERRRDLPSLLREADVVTLHVPLDQATRHLIGEAELRAMKPTAYLINCARGAIVDEAALVRALREGWIAGAGIDVFDPEPPAADNPLFALENVIVTPHLAGLSRETIRLLVMSAVEQVFQVLAGERPPRLVNPEVWARRRGVEARGSAR